MTLMVRAITAARHQSFLNTQASVSFLQIPSWAHVKTDWHGESLGWFDEQRLVGAGLVLQRPIPALHRRSFAYLAEGPVIDWTSELDDWLDPLITYLRDRGAFAIRLGPPVPTDSWSAAQIKHGIADPTITRLTDIADAKPHPNGVRLAGYLRAAGWRPQHALDGFGTGHPQFTFELPLTGKTEDDLRRGMNQQWRRNIAKAEREGVEVTVSDDLSAFHDLYCETAARDRFTPRPLSYFTTMVDAMRVDDPQRVQLYLAHHQGDLVAAAIMIRVGTRAWYAYGASSTRKRDVRGSNACQWAMISDALTAGCDTYSLRGITPTLDTRDPHIGLIQFKVGTGGQAVRYAGEWDYPLRPLTYRAFTAYMRRRDHAKRAAL